MLRCLRRKVATRGERYDGHLIQIKDDIVTLNSLHEDKNEFFDAAILINVLYSVDDPVACLKQAARILKPGGILALSTSHKDTDVDALFRRMKEVLKLKGKYEGLRRNYQAAGDVHRRMEARIHRDSKEMIEGYLDSAGFDIAEWHDREYVGAVFVVKAIKRRSHDEDSWPSLHETPTPDAQVPLSYN
jgi:SAM-dependent methyltransferase